MFEIGGGDGIRTHGTLLHVQRFSNPFHGAPAAGLNAANTAENCEKQHAQIAQTARTKPVRAGTKGGTPACPFCGSDNVRSGGKTADGLTARECRSCGARYAS